MTDFNPVQKELDTLLPRLENEYIAFYFYKAASVWCYMRGFNIAGDYFEHESKDELKHAKVIQDFLSGWGCRFDFPKIEINEDFESLEDIINKSFDLEYNLYVAYSKSFSYIEDRSVYNLLTEFINIQTKSVADFRTLKDKIKNNQSEKNQQLLEKLIFS